MTVCSKYSKMQKNHQKQWKSTWRIQGKAWMNQVSLRTTNLFDILEVIF